MDFIRKCIDADLNILMDIWYKGNLEAHDFVDKSYWDKNKNYVRNALQRADVFVYETDGKVVGFVGMDKDYLAGLFVHRDYRGYGFGTRLIEKIKEEYDYFTLHVFKENYGAYTFYKNRGLAIRHVEVNEDLGEEEYLMYYRKKKEEFS